MARRQYTREFKLEAVRLIRERGVSVTQAARDLDVGEGCVASLGQGGSGGSAAYVSGPGADEV